MKIFLYFTRFRESTFFAVPLARKYVLRTLDTFVHSCAYFVIVSSKTNVELAFDITPLINDEFGEYKIMEFP